MKTMLWTLLIGSALMVSVTNWIPADTRVADDEVLREPLQIEAITAQIEDQLLPIDARMAYQDDDVLPVDARFA